MRFKNYVNEDIEEIVLKIKNNCKTFLNEIGKKKFILQRIL